MNAEKFTVFPGNEGVAAMRAGEPERSGNHFTGAEGLPTDFALILTVTTIVVIDVMVGSPTKRADGIIGNGFTITAFYRFDRPAIFPLIVFKKELPVLFDKSFNDREPVYLEFLIFW